MSTLRLPLEIQEIKAILPHRYPFLLVDRIVALEEDKRVVGSRTSRPTSATSSPVPAAGRPCRPRS